MRSSPTEGGLRSSVVVRAPYEVHPEDNEALHELSGFSEELGAPIEHDDLDDEHRGGTCVQCCRTVLAASWSNLFALQMFLFLVVISTYTSLTHAAKGERPSYGFWAAFLGFSAVPLFGVVILRGCWLALFGRKIIKPAITVLLQVLDPDLTFLGGAIALDVLWGTLARSEPHPTEPGRLQWTLFDRYAITSTSQDRKGADMAKVILILWCIRNVLTNFIMYYFVSGLLRNMNKSVVSVLRSYAMLRRLNANWLRILPVVSEMSILAPSQQPQQNGGNRPADDDLSVPQFVGGGQPQGDATTGETGGTKEEIGAAVAASVISDMRPDSTFKRGTGPLTAATLVQGTSATQRHTQQLEGGLFRRPVVAQVLDLVATRTGRKYIAEETGRTLPKYLRRRGIQATMISNMQNLLAVEWIRAFPIELFVQGEKCILLSRKKAKQVGTLLFAELLSFRNFVAGCEMDGVPANDVEEQDRYVRAAVESQMRQATSVMGSPQTGRMHERSTVASPKSPLRALATNNVLSPALRNRELAGGGPSAASLRLFSHDASHAAVVAPAAESDGTFVRLWNEAPTDVKSVHSQSKHADSEMPSFAELTKFHTEEQLQALPMIDNGIVNLWLPSNSRRPDQVLTRPIIELLMGDQAEEFLAAADLSNRGIVTRRDFVRLVCDLYDSRKQLLNLIDSQDGIRSVFRRVTQGLLTFLAAVGLLFATGIPSSAVLLSGVASLSSITVALSFLYSNFIQSVLFVCFLNPYNVGDRVRFGEDLYTVAKISTYFTEVTTIHGRPSFWPHSLLYNMRIINESRSRNAVWDIMIRVDFDTPAFKLETLCRAMHDWVNSCPDFVHGSCVTIWDEIVVGHYTQLTFYTTCAEYWSNWRPILVTKARIIQKIIEICLKLDITYHPPAQPVILDASTTEKLRQLNRQEKT